MVKKRALEFLENVKIEGKTSNGDKLITNIEFLKEKVNWLYKFVPA